MRTFIFSLLIVLGLDACTTRLTTAPALPEGAEIGEISHEYDPALPVYVMLLELQPTNPTKIPLFPEAPEIKSTGDSYNGPEALIESIMKSSFIRVGNFALLDNQAYRDARSKPQLRPGEVGYFIVRSTLTEFADTVEQQKSRFGSPEFKEGDSAAALIGKFALSVPVFWVSQATLLPTELKSELSKGVIAVDTQIIEARTMQVLTSFTSHGTFSAKTSSLGGSAGWSSSESSNSVAEGALRMALQDAAAKSYQFFLKRYKR